MLVPKTVRLTDHGHPPATLIPAERLVWRHDGGGEAAFEVIFADGVREACKISALANGAWRLHIGQSQEVDQSLTQARAKLQHEVFDHEVRLRAGDAQLTVFTTQPGLAFAYGDKPAWRTVSHDINVGDARQSFPLFRHARGLGVSFELQAGEQICGGGEEFGAMSKNGRTLDFYNADALGVNGMLRYQSTPYIWGSRSGGLALLNAAPSRLNVGATRHDVMTWTTSRPGLTLWVQTGQEAAPAIAHFRRALPSPLRNVPNWSLNLWLSRCYYQDQAEVVQVVQQAKEHGVQAGVINLDARCWMRAETRTDFVWDSARFDPYPQFIGWLRSQELQVCLWENPYVSCKTETLYAEGVDKGYFARTKDGQPYPLEWIPEGLAGFPKSPAAGLVDFTRPEACAWWKDLHRPFIRAGVRCFKTDFGEEIPADAHFADGSDGWMLRNVYADLYNACVTEVLQEETGNDGIVWARSGWFLPSCHPVKWAGDSQTSWRALRATLRGGLGQAVGGALFWSHDIGGFYGAPPDGELFLRWAQAGLWGSHARCHGTTAREPWAFGAPVLQRFREALALRTHLTPYWRAACDAAVQQAQSVMRPLWLMCPNDPQCAHVDDQWFAGEHVLVAPFVEARGGRRVYLPEGTWMDLRTGESLQGERWIHSERTPHLPVFVRSTAPLLELFRAAPRLLGA